MRDKKTKKSITDLCSHGVKIVFVFMLIMTLYVLVHFGNKEKNSGIEIDPVEYIEQWTVIDGDGRSFTTGRFYAAEKDYDKDFTILSTLPEKVEDNMFLCFPTGKNLSIYINGELRDSFDEIKDVDIPGGAVKRLHILVPLEETDAGAELRVERAATTKRGQIVPEAFVGTLGSIYAVMMDKYGLTMMLAEVIQILALLVIIVSIGMRFSYKQKINMLYGALGIFIIASWIITDSLLFPFVFRMNYVDGVVNYMLCLMIPFGPAFYLNSIQGGRYRKSMTAMYVVSCINALVWSILHFTGIFPFFNALLYIDLFMILQAIYAIAILFIELKRGYLLSYKYTAIGFFGFIVFGLFEIANLNFLTIRQEELPMVFGLAFFLTFIVIQQVEDLRKTYVEKQRAIDLSESKSRFLASMSHEIRTPINAILGLNEMILRENKDQVIQEYSRGIQGSGKMLLMLVNDVLDFSKIEAGKLEINETQFCMSDVLRDVLALVRERAQEKQLKINIELDKNVPNGEISDEFRIRQILINLLSNAVKYTDQGSVTLTVGGEARGEKEFLLRIAVKDTGRGIRKEDQRHLFEAFSRADLRQNVNIEGTGLGLAIVKSILDSMHGEIGVESEYGVGSEFWFRLPVQIVDATPLTLEEIERKSTDGETQETCDFVAPKARILVVDDNHSNLTIARLFLKRTMAQVDFCDNGSQAILESKEKKYDIILLDHMMPQPDGIETFHRIKEDLDSMNRTTPIIVLTANAVAGSRQTYLDIGFSDYLSKPLDSAMLERTIKKFLPAGKIMDREFWEKEAEEKQDEVFEFYPEEDQPKRGAKNLRERLESVQGLDYETFLAYCSQDEAMAEEIAADIAAEGPARCERMRNDLEKKDYPAYEIEAHAIKGLMATIGYQSLSEQAKKQEFAVKEGQLDLVLEEGQALIQAYEDICRILAGNH